MIRMPVALRRVVALALGTCLGFTLARIGFTDFEAIHAMFTLADLRLVAVFGTAVGLCAVAYRALPIGGALPTRPVTKAAIVGGILFGIGWAISGSCPGSALAQVGEGRLYSLVALAGIIAGSLLFRPLNTRLLRWDTGSCG
jgi:uncharacterized membrane protein YedE/YeeE